MRRLRALVALTTTAILTTSVLTPHSAAAATGSTVEYTTVPGSQGTDLKAMVITPTGHEGPRPLLVMPSSWSMSNVEYVGAAKKLAKESGYQVISYTSRGFWDSGGEIEVAGPEDIADASSVIDWGLENTDADPDRIGMAGISYGAGISMLTAAEDDRVKAVSAMSGWTDLGASLYPGETISFQAVELLLTAANATGRPGDDLQHIEEEYRNGNIEPALELAQERSVATKIDQVNDNGTAVMMANAYNDGLFPPSQMSDFYTQLDVPKRLMLSAGDHATSELGGAAGLPNKTWDELTRWFDHHLRGVDNGVGSEDPVQVKPSNGNGDWASYPDWESVAAQRETLHLSEPERSWEQWQSTGGLQPEATPGWDYDIHTGRGTLADSGTVLLDGALRQFADIPTGVSLPLVDRYRAGVWTSGAYPEGMRVSGSPSAQVTVTPTTRNQSLYTYLYAVDSHGNGSLITHKPHTVRDATPGEPVTLDLDLEPVVWDLPEDHRLALVIDTADARYTDENAGGEQLEVSSPKGDPSLLTVPTA